MQSMARKLWNNLVVDIYKLKSFIILKDMLILCAHNSNNIPSIHFNLKLNFSLVVSY